MSNIQDLEKGVPQSEDHSYLQFSDHQNYNRHLVINDTKLPVTIDKLNENTDGHPHMTFQRRLDTPIQEVYRQNVHKNQKPEQPIRLHVYDSSPSEMDYEPKPEIKVHRKNSPKKKISSFNTDQLQSQSQGSQLRQNVAKHGLKQYQEDTQYNSGNMGFKQSASMAMDKVQSRDKLLPAQKKVMSFVSKQYDSEQAKSTSNESSQKVYEQTKEYARKQRILEMNRMKKARLWVIIVLSYWTVRFFTIIWPKWKKYDQFTKSNVIVQTSITSGIIISLIWTKIYSLFMPIKYLLYVQAIQMSLMNFNVYEPEDTQNYQGLNTLSSMFSVLFAVSNTYLASIIFDNIIIKLLMSTTVFAFVIFSVISTTFIFGDMTYHTTMSLCEAIFFTCLMIPAFGYISTAIQNELTEEIRISYYERDSFKRMFDALQEGIIVLQANEIIFMNELCNKVMSHLTGVSNFFKHKQGRSRLKDNVDNSDLKLFYLFQNTQDVVKKKKSQELKTEFSLNDILMMTTKELSLKVFTFEKKLTNNDITKMIESARDLGFIIKDLQSMKDIDTEFIPKFKFFQIKKSIIKTHLGEDQKNMVCFIDISQKILYDTSRAEGELLSLINSTISHEMRNPLNSIINQCKILQVVGGQFNNILQNYSHLIEGSMIGQLKHIYNNMIKGNLIMNSSSSLLLLNVEDILGYAQLKAGKFQKIVKRFNIKRCIEDIVSIQMYQAEAKKISLQTKFIGFSAKGVYTDTYELYSQDIPMEHQNLMIESDEKRIKQVLINLQSNALKFTREGGTITITCEYIRGHYPKEKQVKYYHKKGSYSSSETNDSELSDQLKFEKAHCFKEIYRPAQGRDKIVINVIDTGIGIEKKDRLKLFKLFGCLQNTRQMNTQGIGLGLVISENIVKAFQGTIGVKSKFGKGTKFAFSIIIGKDQNFEEKLVDSQAAPEPLHPSSRSLQHISSFSQTWEPEKNSIQSLGNSTKILFNKNGGIVPSVNFDSFDKQGKLKNVGKILIVDDEKFNCDIIDGFLMILGFEGTKIFAYNGEQAVKVIQEAMDDNDPYRFGLILMDCNMPFLDGYEATKAIRKIYSQMDVLRIHQPRIVAITGHVENEYVERALKCGVDKIYPKPLPIKDFGQLLIAMKYIDEVPKHLEIESNED